MKIAHVVTTNAFAGTERYVADVARALSSRGHDVVVLGGKRDAMQTAMGAQVKWQSCPGPAAALWQLARIRKVDVVHAHLTHAETAASLMKPINRGRLVVTRHLATRRGRSIVGSRLVPFIERQTDVQIAISDFVAASVSDAVDVVIRNGVDISDFLFRRESRTVLILQRLEAEKNTVTGLRAWLASGLAAEGWRLCVAGAGSETEALKAEIHGHPDESSVTFLGHVDNVPPLLHSAGILLATAIAEPLGLSVLEAMACGIPVVAASGGGHLETIGAVSSAPTFPPGDVRAAANALRRLALNETLRSEFASRVQMQQRLQHSLASHIDALEEVYA